MYANKEVADAGGSGFLNRERHHVIPRWEDWTPAPRALTQATSSQKAILLRQGPLLYVVLSLLVLYSAIMSSIFVCDEFARLTPENDAAKRLFHDCYTYVKAEEPFHCNFMIGTGTQQSQLLEPLDSDTDYDTTASESETLALGCYSISFASSREPEFPRLGWRVGRGTRKNVNRNVDFLLCKPRDNHDSSKSLTSNHFRLELNSQSGFLVLRAGLNPNASLKYFASGQWEQLEAGSTKLLYMKTTLIQAGICAYALSYIINEKDRQDLLRLRRQYIEKFGSYRTEIFRQFSGLPGDQILETNHFVQYETKGAGSFGWVNQGLDKTTGNVVAIKELQIMPGRSPWEIVKSEVKIGKRFQVYPKQSSAYKH